MSVFRFNDLSSTLLSPQGVAPVRAAWLLSWCLAVALGALSLAPSAFADPPPESRTLEKIDALIAELERNDSAHTANDEKDAVAGFIQLERRRRALRALIGEAVAERDALPGTSSNERVQTLVEEQADAIPTALAEVEQRMDAVRSERLGASTDDQLELEYLLRDYGELESGLLQDLLDNAERAAQLGLDNSAQLRRLDEALQRRADGLAGRVELVLQRLKASEERIGQAPDERKADLEAERTILEERQARMTQGLKATIELMRERDQDVSRYVQLLVSSTGEISGDIFDSRVILGLVDEWLSVIRDTIARDGPGWFFKFVVFVVIVGTFKVLSNIVARVVRRTVSASKMHFSSLLQEFFVTTASNAVLVVGLLIALSQLGIQLGPVLAGLGVAGFILGFALQETLSNFASGMMILIYRPFDVGDVVEAGGVNGKVSQMSLVSTTILTFDNQKLVVPNNKIWGDVIRNVNAEPNRRVDMIFGIGYDDDIAQAEAILKDIIGSHELVLADPAPNIRLHTLGESSVDFIVRPWTRASDYWDVYWDVTRTVKQRFDAEGISIPYPQRDLHVYQESATAD